MVDEIADSASELGGKLRRRAQRGGINSEAERTSRVRGRMSIVQFLCLEALACNPRRPHSSRHVPPRQEVNRWRTCGGRCSQARALFSV
jgi:hypothetical protein